MKHNKELEGKNSEELKKELNGEIEKLRAIGFQLGAGTLKQVRDARNSRKTIARIKTLINRDKNGKK